MLEQCAPHEVLPKKNVVCKVQMESTPDQGPVEGIQETCNEIPVVLGPAEDDGNNLFFPLEL